MNFTYTFRKFVFDVFNLAVLTLMLSFVIYLSVDKVPEKEAIIVVSVTGGVLFYMWLQPFALLLMVNIYEPIQRSEERLDKVVKRLDERLNKWMKKHVRKDS